ncbi:hypothetical protein ACVXZZ_07925 [Staphylococcus aureus]
MEGKGFKCFVKQNDRVEAGNVVTILLAIYTTTKGYNADVIVVISTLPI